ncbi:hypothetical protein MIMGU_mgv11b016998mg [Erythranthe guttata]|uniref:Uncharacterized protein n=1 Tax=Erythranthe guttata TaxID=4155 RepID=A0A022QQN3_ERYGU|nr:hypothetical protein MIMGU_mgv11b016998mg [Erythranthe guttata]
MNYGLSSNQFDWVAYNEQILEEDNEADALARLHYEAAVNQEVVRGGSIPGRKYKPRDQKGKHEQLMYDYFIDNPVFVADDFRRWFRMKRHLLLRLVEDCERSNSYFQRKFDRAHKLGFSLLQKSTGRR